MGSVTDFFWLQLPNVIKNYCSALAITGPFTAIATYHHVQIFKSWIGAFEVSDASVHKEYHVTVIGAPLNHACSYVDWLLTVPLSLIELILMMKLLQNVMIELARELGVASAVMVALGYPGEIQNSLGVRWLWWALAMLPFSYVVFTLVAGLNEATDKQPESARGLVAAARYVTAISWLTYPFVYIIKSCGLAGSIATALEQVGYSIADFVAKAVFGVLIYAIAAAKSEEEESGLLK